MVENKDHFEGYMEEDVFNLVYELQNGDILDEVMNLVYEIDLTRDNQ
jgi:hypothetical protein